MSRTLSVKLIVKSDQRRKGLDLGAKRLQSLAADLIKDQEVDDDYCIVTKTGQRIGPDQILMRKVVELDALGKSVNREQAWKELQEFYSELGSTGALEQ